MKLKGEAQKFPGMYIFDSIMRRTFGRSVKLVSYYGPVQMCVFGLEYEQNPDAVGFYEHLGFATYKRTDLDEEGNPYPLLYMRSEERERG